MKVSTHTTEHLKWDYIMLSRKEAETLLVNLRKAIDSFPGPDVTLRGHYDIIDSSTAKITEAGKCRISLAIME